MEFIDDDFTRMRFNPRVVPITKSVVEHYEDLRRIFTRTTMIELETAYGYGGAERVARYVCYMYDMNTPLQRITNYGSRKTTAMKLAGFPIKDNELQEPTFPKEWEGPSRSPNRDLYANKGILANRVIVLFIRAFKDYKYTHLKAMEETYFRNIENMMNGNNSSSQDKGAMEVVEKTKKMLDELYEEIYTAKPELELMQETMMVMEEEGLGIEPEDIARRLKNGEYIKPY